MEEKKIFVTKATLPPKEEFIQYVDKIWDSAWLTNILVCKHYGFSKQGAAFCTAYIEYVTKISNTFK